MLTGCLALASFRCARVVADARPDGLDLGRVEVVDMMRAFDLTMDGAQEVSEHLPAWAEFSVYEGGQPGHAAIVR